MGKQPKYSEHLDTIVALITHLAMTHHNMRTPPNLAKAISLEEKEITFVLEHFKALFRKSQKIAAKTGTHFYSLQIRYAKQWLEDSEEEAEDKKPPLETEYITALLDFVTRKAEQERNHGLGLVTAWITASASLIVAVLAILFR